jgi:uncharacterized membrane protein YgaE (UPF0421/DUF939 family)
MGKRIWTRIILILVGAIIGTVAGYFLGHSTLTTMVGAGIGALGFGLFGIIPPEALAFLLNSLRF